MAKAIFVMSHPVSAEQKADIIDGFTTEVVELPDDLKKLWSQIPTTLDMKEVENHLQPILQWLEAEVYDATHDTSVNCTRHTICVAGEASSCNLIWKRWNTECCFVTAVSRRESSEVIQPDGSVVKTNVFKHLGFRVY